MAVFKVLMMPFNANRAFPTENALAADAVGQVADPQEVLVVQVGVEAYNQGAPYGRWRI